MRKKEKKEKKSKKKKKEEASKKVQKKKKKKKDMENRLEAANQELNQALQANTSLEIKLTGLSKYYKESLQKKDRNIQELENELDTYRPKNKGIRRTSYSSNDDTDT